MGRKAGCLVALLLLFVLGALAWRPLSDFVADDACLDSGGKISSDHACIH